MQILKFFCFFWIFYSLSVAAENKGDSLNISFTGRLITSTVCTVNSNKNMVVAFGEVGVNKVASGQYVKDIPYTLDCGAANASNKVRMTIKAVPVTGDNTAIATSSPGLWVKFLKDGIGVEINNEFAVDDWRNPPLLQLQLEKDPAVELHADNFTATATIVADYI